MFFYMKLFTEKDWLDVDQNNIPYFKSKALAERAAWDFVAALPDKDKFELTAINPGQVMGPALVGSSGNSITMMQGLLTGQMPLPK